MNQLFPPRMKAPSKRAQARIRARHTRSALRFVELALEAMDEGNEEMAHLHRKRAAAHHYKAEHVDYVPPFALH